MCEVKDSIFATLNKVDVSEKTEKKGNLTYLSWAWAWGEVKKRYPEAKYTIYESKDGCMYHTDGRTCWVKTGVTIGDLEYIEYLPVMDNRNNSIAVDRVTSFDANKAIQRSLTKAIARHGLGLYIYAGEDLPEKDPPMCADCGKPVTDEFIANGTLKAYGRVLCRKCGMKAKQALTNANGGTNE